MKYLTQDWSLIRTHQHAARSITFISGGVNSICYWKKKKLCTAWDDIFVFWLFLP